MDEKTPHQEFEQKTIRTYEGDIAEAIEHRQTSEVSMALAANKRKNQEEQAEGEGTHSIMVGESAMKPKSSLGKNIFKILISLILIGGGIIGAYYLYTISPLAVQPTVTEQQTAPALIPSIITPDIQKTLNVEGQSDTQIIKEIQSQSIAKLNSGGILEIVPYVSNAKVTSQQFMSDVGLTPPDLLTRSLTNSWMLGIYADSQGNPKPFIILTTNFFQNAFSGMLQWEPTMPDDLSKIFGMTAATVSAPILSAPMSASSTSSATSTTLATSTATTSSQQQQAQSLPPSATYFAIRGSFSDKVIQNKDAREFTDGNGNTLFLYAFIDNNTLVIAGDEATLGEVINRFEKRAYVR